MVHLILEVLQYIFIREIHIKVHDNYWQVFFPQKPGYRLAGSIMLKWWSVQKGFQNIASDRLVDRNFTELRCLGSSEQVSIGLGNGVVPNRCQAINCTNWCKSAEGDHCNTQFAHSSKR